MKKSDLDSGTIAALMVRLREERIPRARKLMEKVNSGETLSEHDIQFLQRVHEDSKNSRTLLERNPEYRNLINRYTELYTAIIAKALENEQN